MGLIKNLIITCLGEEHWNEILSWLKQVSLGSSQPLFLLMVSHNSCRIFSFNCIILIELFSRSLILLKSCLSSKICLVLLNYASLVSFLYCLSVFSCSSLSICRAVTLNPLLSNYSIAIHFGTVIGGLLYSFVGGISWFFKIPVALHRCLYICRCGYLFQTLWTNFKKGRFSPVNGAHLIMLWSWVKWCSVLNTAAHSGTGSRECLFGSGHGGLSYQDLYGPCEHPMESIVTARVVWVLSGTSRTNS